MKQAGRKTSPAERCAELIREARAIGALTGAGISTNAGIPDFRGPNGLYVTRRYDPDTVFDIGFFYRDPKPFYEFARDFIELEQKIKPTPTHMFLAALEKTGKLKGIVTQNIDALHYKAGSEKVYEMHGSIWESYCLICRQKFSYETMKGKLKTPDIPLCACGGVIKPDVVFFGEDVKYFAEASALAEASDLFFVIGSSCVVYPAAAIPTLTQGKIVVVNKGEVELNAFNIALTVEEDADDFFSEVAELLGLEVS
jgi:NAD-dependent deacetylase